MGVNQLQIHLDGDVFWAGQTVRGHVTFSTAGDVKCRGVRVKLVGQGFMKNTRGDDETYYGRKRYVEEQYTIYGKNYKTSTLDGCGANADFGVFPGAGTVYIPLPAGSGHRLIIRAMDADWGKSDDLLAEAEIDVDQLLTKNWEPMTVGMTLKGNACPSTATLRGGLVNQASVGGEMKQVLRVDIMQLLKLKSGDWLSKNDVYGQVYLMSDAVATKAKGLPPPESQLTIPSGTSVSFPVEFTIPPECPSSLEGRLGYRKAYYVRYSVYAYVDVAWKMDPSTRRGISVVSPTPMWPGALVSRSQSQTKSAGCCGCGGGDVTVDASIDRMAYAPGELMTITGRAANGGSKAMNVHVKFIRIDRCESSPSNMGGFTEEREWTLLTEVIQAGGTLDWSAGRQLMVPVAPPTFFGGSSGWRKDPVTWHYVVRITVDIPMAPDTTIDFPITVVGVPLPTMEGMAARGQVEFSRDGPMAAPGAAQMSSDQGPMPPPGLVYPTPAHMMEWHPTSTFVPSSLEPDPVAIVDMDESQEDCKTLDPSALQWTPHYMQYNEHDLKAGYI